MRIFWSSNAPWCPSGYGVQTKLICGKLREAGHDIALGVWHGLAGARIVMDGVPFYPGGGSPYGQDTLVADATDFRADIAVTLIDAWVYNGMRMPPQFRWTPYFPVDSEPCAPAILEAVRPAYERLVFTRQAEEMMHAAGMTALYLPHIIDCDLYTPGDAKEARQRAGLPPEGHLTAVVAANKGYPSRKSWPQLLEAWIRFAKVHDDAKLYLHTYPGDQSGATCDLPTCIEKLSAEIGCDVKRRVAWVDNYQNRLAVPDQFLRDVYRGADVLLNPAMGEGFGIPIVEAQACGCPVIAGNWTGMSETAGAGWIIPHDRQHRMRFWLTGYNTFQFVPFPEAILECLENAYTWAQQTEAEKEPLRIQARHHAMQYNVASAWEQYWVPGLQALSDRINAGAGELKMVQF